MKTIYVYVAMKPLLIMQQMITIVVIKGLASRKWMGMLIVKLDQNKVGNFPAMEHVNSTHNGDIPQHYAQIKPNVSSQCICVEVFQCVESK